MRTPFTKQTSPNISNNFSRKTKDKPNHAATTHIKQPDKQNHKISKSTTLTKIKTDKYNNTFPVTWKTTSNSPHRPKKTAQMPTSPTNLRWITKDHITQQLHWATINSPNTKQIKIPNQKQNILFYFKSGTIERYKTTKFTKKNINHNAYENQNIWISTVCIKVEK